jgi:hypothetical protein
MACSKSIAQLSDMDASSTDSSVLSFNLTLLGLAAFISPHPRTH